MCISHPQILLYTARCLLFVQERNSPLNFPNSAHTSGQLSIYARVNISCSEKPLNYPFETQVNALNNRTTLVALTLSSLAHNTDLLPDSQWDTHTHTLQRYFPGSIYCPDTLIMVLNIPSHHCNDNLRFINTPHVIKYYNI